MACRHESQTTDPQKAAEWHASCRGAAWVWNSTTRRHDTVSCDCPMPHTREHERADRQRVRGLRGRRGKTTYVF